MELRTLLLVLILTDISTGWKRSALIYNIPKRSTQAWERHLMRINSAGGYTGQWLFDAAILTSESVNGKGVYVADGFTGQDYMDFLNLVFGDAAKLDSAMRSLASNWGRPPAPEPFQIFVGIPYLNPNSRSISLNGKTYNFSVPTQRLTFGKWYVDEVRRRVRAKPWYNFNFGLYYHLEEAVERSNDPAFLVDFNKYAHDLGFKTLWVPFFDSEGAWNGTGMGFDFVSVQPRLSFLSAIDGGNLKGDRLHSTGYKCVSQGHALEYELRDQGELELSYWLAHQYLSISQVTGSSEYTQVFFVGGPDIFDRITNEASAPSRFMWMTYQDLSNYLRGDTIPNWEILVPWNPTEVNQNLRQVRWTSTYENLNSIRYDFVDFNINNPWRGKLAVSVSGTSSFAMRIGTDSLGPNYNSVFVPLSNLPISIGIDITIQLSRENNSPWPRVIRVVAGKFEQKYVSNSIFGEASSSSNPVQQITGTHADSIPTHVGNDGAGKVTDGKISPRGEWWWGGQVGWNLNENAFTITIDLGVVMSVQGIRIFAYKDIAAGIQWPEKVGGFLGLDCSPSERGNLEGCVPAASLGKLTSKMRRWPGSARYNGTITGNFFNGARGRYVTMTGQCRGWCILDEVEVIDAHGLVASTGKSYRVTPVPGEYNKSVAYGDNSQLLVDGAIFSDWIFGKLNSVGLQLKDDAQFVHATWASPRKNLKFGSIWVTRSNIGWGISVPVFVNIQWRNQDFIWTTPAQVPFEANCGGGSPCARLAFSAGSVVTGIRGTFPANQMWVMVTEISVL